MSEQNISLETNKKIDELVKRVARKAGYSGGELTYQQHLQMKLENVQRKLNQKFQRQRHKFGFSPKNNDFAEEVKTYLSDGIADLIAQDYSEEEAFQITMDKFDEAELKPNFEEFMQEFNDFGLQEQMQWHAENGEAIGLYFAAFMVLGLSLGAIFGWLAGHSLVSCLIGMAAGFSVGIGLGLLSFALLITFKKK